MASGFGTKWKASKFPSLTAEAKQKGCLLSLLQINVTGLKSFPLKQGLTSWLHDFMSKGLDKATLGQQWKWACQNPPSIWYTWLDLNCSSSNSCQIDTHNMETSFCFTNLQHIHQNSQIGKYIWCDSLCCSNHHPLKPTCYCEHFDVVPLLIERPWYRWRAVRTTVETCWDPHFVAAATCRQDSASNTRWASGSADGGQYKQWPQVEEEVVNLEGENLDKCHMESNNFSFSKISHEDLRITITQSFS